MIYFPSNYIAPNQLGPVASESALHLIKWGDATGEEFASYRHRNRAVCNKISKVASEMGFDWWKNDFYICMIFQPAPSVDDPTKMAIYESRAKFDLERRTIGKPARMLRKIFPDISESMANEFAIWWQERFAVCDDSFSITESSEKEEFIASYIGAQSKTFDPSFDSVSGFSFKSLVASCMRHDFDDLPIHPVAAYASGDFKIVTCRDSSGKIAARCVVSVATVDGPRDKGFAGPVYTTSDTVSALMAQYMDSHNIVPNSSWIGSRMLRIQHDDQLVLPYVDGIRTLDDKGDVLVFARRGDVDASETSGLVNLNSGELCECCGDRFDSECEGAYLDCANGYVCDACLSDEYFYCEYIGQHIPNSETVLAYSYYRWGVNAETVSQANATESGDYTLTADDEYWACDDVVMLNDSGECYPCKSDDIFQSDIDDEYYLIEERVQHNGLNYTTDQFAELMASESELPTKPTDDDATETETQQKAA